MRKPRLPDGKIIRARELQVNDYLVLMAGEHLILSVSLDLVGGRVNATASGLILSYDLDFEVEVLREDAGLSRFDREIL